MLEHRQVRLPDGEVRARIVLDAEQSEAVLDLLEKRYAGEGRGPAGLWVALLAALVGLILRLRIG